MIMVNINDKSVLVGYIKQNGLKLPNGVSAADLDKLDVAKLQELNY